MRAWPNAPRACLLESTSRSDVTCVDRSVMFFCALSITASRSCSFCSRSTVWLRGVGHRLADPLRHGVEPLVDEPRKLGLPARQHLAHGLDAAGGLGLDLRHFGHALLQLLRLHGACRRRRARRRAAAHHDDHEQHHRQDASRRRAEHQRRAERDGTPPISNRISFMADLLARFGYRTMCERRANIASGSAAMADRS